MVVRIEDEFQTPGEVLFDLAQVKAAGFAGRLGLEFIEGEDVINDLSTIKTPVQVREHVRGVIDRQRQISGRKPRTT